MKNDPHRRITKSGLDSVKIELSVEGNKLLQEVLDWVNSSDEIKTLWKVINVNATNRLGMTDHGPTHFQIVANNALTIARIFKKKGIEMSIVKDLGLTNDHSEVVIFLASVMHDLGMSIHRIGHEEFSLFLANRLLQDVLSFLPTEERAVVISETLHAIISHRAGGEPYTIEAGIVRIADALDMTKGRSRIPTALGNIDIHSVSHQSIESVGIVEGTDRPVEIKVVMTNPAGIFQVDDLMQDKLKGGGIEKYIGAKAYILEDGKEKLFKEFIL
ncbi:MAG: HD domain-containing protein [Microgenomates group bacterium]